MNLPLATGGRPSLLAKHHCLYYNLRRVGRIAQLVRALLSHSRGPGFESLCAHKNRLPKNQGAFFV
jgi:hypothetical protein